MSLTTKLVKLIKVETNCW